MADIIELKNKREVFWDDYLVDGALSNTSCVLEPIEAEPTVLKWLDDMITSYPCIVKTDDEYRMYYVGGYITTDVMTESADTYHLSARLLTSKDGISWEHPKIPGKKDGVVVDKILDNFFVFIDENPLCPPEEKFKALTSGYYIDNNYGLYLLTSPDGLNFTPARLLTDRGTFDSCNTLHYINGKYICYVRTWHDYTPEANRPKNLMNDFFDIPSPDKDKCQMRSISVLYSDDCKNWEGPFELRYDDDLDHQMYTNNAMVYDRAPHMIIGFPTRYCQRERWNENFNQMGGLKRRLHAYNSVNPREGVSITDCLFMFSRDTKNFLRFSEAFMRPGFENDFNWVYGDCYPAFGLVDSGKEYYMMYTIEHHLEFDSPHPLCMYKVRKDGFACQKADSKEQILVTKPFVFEGSVLHLNMSTSAYGYIYVDVLDENGNELSKKESFEIFGNTIDRKVLFDDGEDFSKYQGKPIRLRFRMRDAKLYSMKFE